MTINFKLLLHEPMTKEGHPLNLVISHKGIKKTKKIAFAFPEQWLDQEQNVSVKHPDHDILAPMIADLKNRARKIVLQRYESVDRAYLELFAKETADVVFVDAFRKIIDDMKSLVAELRKSGDDRSANKLSGNVSVYENVFAQFEIFALDSSIQNIDYNLLMRFRNYKIGTGCSKATVNLYLRTLRSVYNKALLLYKMPDHKPFVGVFKGLAVKSYNSKKKYLSDGDLVKLEAYFSESEKQKYVDLFLLQFYFGGCDLIDLYYLKKRQIRNGRLYFERTKTNTGAVIDLKIHEKANFILQKYISASEWVFPWPKEREKYVVFRRTCQRGLIYVQEKLGIEVNPGGGKIGIKVARHTFATRAKRLGIEEDLLRELMGHERNDVDNYYKDRFSEKKRDQALLDIITI